MKTLFIGGVKSGKSRLAEDYVLKHAKDKPIYLATSEFIDDEMRVRIAEHKQRRADRFETVEEAVNLRTCLVGRSGTVLVECVSIWLNNMLHREVSEEKTLQELKAVLCLPLDIVFVLNEVGMGVVPDNPLARRFVDLSGKSGQLLGQACDEVYLCSAGLALKIK